MATTLEKIDSLVEHLRSAPPETVGAGGDLVELLQIAQGFGLDPLAMIVPSSEAEADVLVDHLISLLLQVRGDDLPPFDLTRYGEAAET